MHLDFVNELLFQYGLYAVFILVMLEGDITLLLAGVLAHSGFFGEYSFAQVLIWGTIAGSLSDNIAYFSGRGFCEGVRKFRFYRAAQPRLERLTTKFGPLSIFLSKYIYGLRWASCVFYGVGRMPYLRFLPLSFASCFLWVIVVLGVVGFYLTERFWLSPKVEEADPERLQEFEHAATEKLQDLKQEFQEHIPFKHR